MIGTAAPADLESGSASPADRRRPGAAAARRLLRASWMTVLSLAGTAILWEVAARVLNLPLLFPGVVATFEALGLGLMDGTLPEAVGTTLVRLAQGFAIGILIGAPLGMVMGHVPAVRWFFEPYVNIFRFVTPIALLSIIITWFGSGEASIIVLVVYITTFIVLLNAMVGVMSVPDVTLRAARSLGARPLRLFVSVIAPAALHSVLTGMRIAVGYAFMTVVAAEIIAGNSGLGYLIWTARMYLNTPTLFAGLLTLAVVGLIVDRLFMGVARRTTGRYLHGAGA